MILVLSYYFCGYLLHFLCDTVALCTAQISKPYALILAFFTLSDLFIFSCLVFGPPEKLWREQNRTFTVAHVSINKWTFQAYSRCAVCFIYLHLNVHCIHEWANINMKAKATQMNNKYTVHFQNYILLANRSAFRNSTFFFFFFKILFF